MTRSLLLGSWVFVCGLGLGGARNVAAAEPDPRPHVSRGMGAEVCPDLGALSAQIAAIGGPADAFTHSDYTVAFAYSPLRGGTFWARIRRANDQSERVLEAQGVSCVALAQATAVTLALLLDSERSSPPAPAPPPASGVSAAPADVVAPTPTVASAPVAVSSVEPVQPSRTQPLRAFAIGVGGAALLGVLRSATPALFGEAGLESARWSIALGGLWAVPHTRALGPGSVQARLASGLANVCFFARAEPAPRVGVCSGAQLGVIAVQARGYTLDREREALWLAVPLGLSLGLRPAPIGVTLTAGALFPVRRHDFSIDGVGTAYRSWPVAGSITLQISAGGPRSRTRPRSSAERR